MTHRISAILVVLWFVALGTGLIARAHDAQHAREDALEASRQVGAGKPTPAREPVRHDDTNCAFHAQLHLPIISIAWVPLLVCLGLWVAFVTQLPRSLISRQVPTRLGCRGPPTC